MVKFLYITSSSAVNPNSMGGGGGRSHCATQKFARNNPRVRTIIKQISPFGTSNDKYKFQIKISKN